MLFGLGQVNNRCVKSELVKSEPMEHAIFTGWNLSDYQTESSGTRL